MFLNRFNRPVRAVGLTIAGAFALSAQLAAQEYGVSAMRLSGDFRLRYEHTENQQVIDPPPPNVDDARDRMVLRFRAGMTIPINEFFTVGARVATGAPDDPNTADVTLGDFVDDLNISLDRAYVEFNYQNLMLTGGKFPNPLTSRRDLVWDGDVNPQGLAGRYTFTNLGVVQPRVNLIYSIVDEQALAGDSYMYGGQAEVGIRPSDDWTFTAAASYLDYTIKSLNHADGGDIRSNYLNADSTNYLSDFDMLDLIGIVEYRGLSERFPVRFVADFVKNHGAAVPEDQGFVADLYVGRVGAPRDVRFQYGYSQAQTDAVLAAFSHDNTTLPTDYILHTVTLDYTLLQNTTLSATWYHFRRKDQQVGTNNTFADRIRLNIVIQF